MCLGEALDSILERHPAEPGALVELLQDVQKQLHYLPRPALEAAARHVGVPRAKVFSVATFYKTFSLNPRGEHLVRVCTGTACHVRGAALVVDELEKQLEVAPGETTPDMKYTLEVVNCVGACALAPVVMVNEDVHATVKPSAVADVLPGGQS
jgi:NADH-quinone oxidoreductase subunit E